MVAAALPAAGTVYISGSSSIRFAYTQGAPPAAPQNVTLTGVGSFSVAAVATNPAGWLQVSPQSGRLPAVLAVSVSPAGLNAGEYQGVVQIIDPTCTGTFSCSVAIYVYLTVQQGQATSGTGARTIFIPQVADGDSWSTTFYVVNSTSSSQRATLQFWGDGAYPLRLPIQGQLTSSVPITLPPYGSKMIQTSGTGSDLAQGWALVLPETAGTISAAAVFRQRIAGRPDFEVGVPAMRAARSMVFPFDMTGGYVTSFAVVNTLSDGHFLLIARDESGNVITQRNSRALIPGEHLATSLSDFSELAGQRGTIELVSVTQNTPGLAAIVLRFNPTGAPTAMQPLSSQ